MTCAFTLCVSTSTGRSARGDTRGPCERIRRDRMFACAVMSRTFEATRSLFLDGEAWRRRLESRCTHSRRGSRVAVQRPPTASVEYSARTRVASRLDAVIRRRWRRATLDAPSFALQHRQEQPWKHGGDREESEVERLRRQHNDDQRRDRAGDDPCAPVGVEVSRAIARTVIRRREACTGAGRPPELDKDREVAVVTRVVEQICDGYRCDGSVGRVLHRSNEPVAPAEHGFCIAS